AGVWDRAPPSYRHDLVFFGLDQLVDALDVLFGHGFDLVVRVSMVVLRDLLVFLELLQHLEGVAPVVADGDPVVLRDLLHVLDQLLPPLLGERRDRHANDLAVVLRREAEIGGVDRALDRGERRLVVGLDHEERRLRGVDLGHLVERRARTVVLDEEPVEELRVRASGADVPEVLLEGGHRRLHFLLGRVEDFVGHARPPYTKVPIRSPWTARMMFPGRIRLNTRIGMLLSMHKEIAVASMTWSCRLSTSM